MLTPFCATCNAVAYRRLDVQLSVDGRWAIIRRTTMERIIAGCEDRYAADRAAKLVSFVGGNVDHGPAFIRLPRDITVRRRLRGCRRHTGSSQ